MPDRRITTVIAIRFAIPGPAAVPVPEHAVCTVLTLQTALVFLLTSFFIAAVSPLRALGGWPLAFGLFAVGPALGIAAMRRLAVLRSARSMGG